MNRQAINQYLNKIQPLYKLANRDEKSEILDTAEYITSQNRDHIGRKLRSDFADFERKKGSGRPPKYDKTELLPHIEYLWVQMERISPLRMKAGLSEWLPDYKECPAHLRIQLLAMSASTLGRYLDEVRAKTEPQKGLSTTSPARHMKNKVPINTLDSKVNRPGYTQTDTVAHCGTSARGPFVSSLTLTDIQSTWTENRAMLTKTGTEVKNCFVDIKQSLPFTLLAINSDSGSEFLNKEMFKFTGHGQKIIFTRSRPYKKNDNCYVEQKNFTHVRELFGYERFEDRELVVLMNEIYTEYWNPLQNFFIPTFKLKEKVRIGGRIKKTYDKPITPYRRLMNSPHLTAQQKNLLRHRKEQLNPFELKQGLECKLKEFFDIVRKRNTRKVA